MASFKDAPNPLRPYYIPPSFNPSSDAPAASSPPLNSSAAQKQSSSYASSARDIFSDIDYSDYLSDASPSTVQTIKDLIDDALYKYTSILIAQPWENAKTVLQVQSQAAHNGLSRSTSLEDLEAGGIQMPEEKRFDDLSEDSENDELSYFSSTAPHNKKGISPTRHRSRRSPERTPSFSSSQGARPSSPIAPYRLVLRKPDSLLEAISQLWNKEGAWGVWKGSNSTFVYGVAIKTLENWVRGLLAALFNIPDPGAISGISASTDLLNSQQPWASLAIAVAAAAVAGITLAPLDLVRTKLVLTPTQSPKRSLTQALSQLPSLICPPILFIPTLLNSIVTPFVTHTSPLLLRSYLSIDPVISPTSHSISTFFTSAVELFVKLPVETVLRRGQVAVLSSPAYNGGRPLETIVEPGPYKGMFGTMWSIVYEEGESAVSSPQKSSRPRSFGPPKPKKTRKGQGLEGLCRGWRVGMWALIGLWGANALGGGGKGGEF